MRILRQFQRIDGYATIGNRTRRFPSPQPSPKGRGRSKENCMVARSSRFQDPRHYELPLLGPSATRKSGRWSISTERPQTTESGCYPPGFGVRLSSAAFLATCMALCASRGRTHNIANQRLSKPHFPQPAALRKAAEDSRTPRRYRSCHTTSVLMNLFGLWVIDSLGMSVHLPMTTIRPILTH